MGLFMSSRALKMLGDGLAAQIELYECFWGNLVIYTPTQLVGTLKIYGLINGTTFKFPKIQYFFLHHVGPGTSQRSAFCWTVLLLAF